MRKYQFFKKIKKQSKSDLIFKTHNPLNLISKSNQEV
jgi:hypothetical protein